MISALLISLAAASEPFPLPVAVDERPGHWGQIDVHLDMGQPIELDRVGFANSGHGLLGLGAGYWLPQRFQLGLELRLGAVQPPGLQPVGVNWGHLLVAKGFSPAENWLLSAALLVGYYNNSYSIYPDAGLRIRALYEIAEHFDLGIAATSDLAAGEVHDPIFFTIEATVGFSFR